MKGKRVILFVLLAFSSIIFPLVAQNVTESTPDVCISGIMYDGDRSTVIINGETIKLGETIKKITIANVTESTVTLQYNDQTFEKRIGEGCAKPVVSIINQSAAQGKGKNSKTAAHGKSQTSTYQDFEKMVSGQAFLFVFIVVFLSIGGYVYNSVCLQKIADKTATDNGWLAWIPIANLFLMLMIARRPLWWFILLLLPLVNVIIMIILWMDISKMCNKASWLGVLMILPLVNFIVMGYLAFSASLTIGVAPFQVKKN